MARVYNNGLQHTCDQCGGPITKHDKPDPYGYHSWPRTDKKYCSNACRQKSLRNRRRLARTKAKNTASRATARSS